MEQFYNAAEMDRRLLFVEAEVRENRDRLSGLDYIVDSLMEAVRLMHRIMYRGGFLRRGEPEPADEADSGHGDQMEEDEAPEIAVMPELVPIGTGMPELVPIGTGLMPDLIPIEDEWEESYSGKPCRLIICQYFRNKYFFFLVFFVCIHRSGDSGAASGEFGIGFR